MWISPAFKVKVIRTFDAVATNQLTNPAQMSRMQLIQLAMQAEEERLQLEHTVDELKPRAAVADRITVAEGRLCIRDAAKVLQTKERALITWLLMNKWMFRDQKGRLRGYSDKMPKYIEHKITPIPTDADAEKVSTQALITPAGITRLADIFNVEMELVDFKEAA
jgi:phage antirepressor YoqD-like protein